MSDLQIKLLRRRRTKIVATLGPASNDIATIRGLAEAGVSMFRLNMSHGDHAGHKSAYDLVREVSAALGEPIAVLADLCGPKIRVGRFAGGEIMLTNGERVTVTTRDIEGGPGLIPSQYEALAGDVTPGCRILLSDGLLELRVEAVDGTEITCTVIHGGTLKDRKGMNLPDANVSAPALTEKDRVDAEFALGLGVDFLALSFVRRASDITELRNLIPAGGATKIVAKIEKPEALDNIDEILEVSDAIMVARGDLGVELPPEVVPVAQRRLVAKARKTNKPAIVATQMLETMIEHPQPTRAEVSDVATAVFDSADAVMLSAETASGRYPLRAVAIMDRIARHAEASQWAEALFGRPETSSTDEIALPDAISRSTAQLSRDLRVRCILVLSKGGATAEVVAGSRPAAPVVAVTTDLPTWRHMNLLWGVVPVLVEEGDLDDPHALARRLAVELGLAETGQYILVVAGFGRTPAQRAPSVTVITV
jgi:pyruvate kinase